jgi:hypothetical protein
MMRRLTDPFLIILVLYIAVMVTVLLTRGAPS